MADNVTVIDIVAQVTDATDPGASSATSNVGKLEKAMKKVQSEIDKMKKMSKLEITMYATDKASKGIDSVFRKGWQFSGTVFSATVSIIDKVTAPIRGMISKIGDMIGIAGIASTVLGGLTVKSALTNAAIQSRVETQLSTVLKNMGVSQADNNSILRRATQLQGQTMYSGTALTAGAAEFATYLSDARAIEQMMGTLTDYAAGMSGGVELTEMQMVDYATQLGKALNGADAAFDGLRKKGFAFSEAQKEILRSELTSDLEKTAVLSEIIAESWEGLAQQFANTPTGKISQVKNKWVDILTVIGQKLEPSVGRFFNMIDARLPAIGNLLTRGAEGLGSFFDRLIPSIGHGIDGAISNLEKLGKKLSEITNRRDFQDSSLFGKIGILWDELIVAPFDEWWSGKGKAWLAAKSQNIGKGIGSAIRGGISFLFGIDARGALDDGVSIGKSFSKGFNDGIEGIDWSKVADGIKNAMMKAVKLIFSNPVTGGIASLWLAGKVSGGISAGRKIFTAGKGLLGSLFASGMGSAGAAGAGTATTGMFPGVAQGLAMRKAAMAPGAGANAMLAFSSARSGSLGFGAKMGSAGLGSMALGAAGVAGGVVAAVGLVDAATDLMRGLRVSDERERSAYIGSAGWKAGGIAAGATIGTLILPGIGTAIGAGVGYLGGKFMGDRRIKNYEEEVRENEAAIAKQQAAILEGVKRRFGNVKLSMSEIQNIAEKITFGDMKEGIDSFSEATIRANNSMTNLRRTASELGRLNWKAEIGLDYDRQEYRSGVDAFIANVKDYVESRQYEITTATRLLLGSESDASGINSIFASMQADIDSLGAELTAKFNVTGELDTEGIADLQNQIIEMTKKISTAEFEGGLDVIKMQFGGGKLDQSSFELLQSEIIKNAEVAKGGIAEAYSTAFFGLRLELNEGKISKDVFDERSIQWQEAFDTKIAGIDTKGIGLLMEEIAGMFELEADQILPDLEGTLAEKLTQAATVLSEVDTSAFEPTDWAKFFGVDEGLAGELGEFLKPIPYMMTKEFIKSFEKASPLAADEAYRLFSGNMRSKFASQLVLDVPVTINSNITTNPRVLNEHGALPHATYGVSPHADGGILRAPHIGLVGEDGPEAIIPLSAKRRNRGLSLWEKAGQMLGAVPYAEGGIIGLPLIPNSNTTSGASGGTVVAVPVEIQNVTFEVNIDSENAADTEAIVQILKDNIKNLTDEIAHSIAISLQQVFENMPKVAEGAY
jgi:hypothetical protein